MHDTITDLGAPELMPDGLPRPNLPLLRKVLDHIDAHPSEWNQPQFADRSTGCGTAFCVAGLAAFMSGATPQWLGPEQSSTSNFLLPDGSVGDVQDYATEQLGLTEFEGSLSGLFDPGNSRADVQRHAEEIAARAGERL